MSRFVVGITGASGSMLGMQLLKELLLREHQLYVVVSSAGVVVLNQELGLNLEGLDEHDMALAIMDYLKVSGSLTVYHENNIAAPIASGSFFVDGMVVIPCSMGTASAIANGTSGNLIERAADVTIKEGRKLIVVPRETPVSRIHLKNLSLLAEYGVMVMPPVIAFYANPKTLEEAAGYFIGRVLNALGIQNDLMPVWEGM